LLRSAALTLVARVTRRFHPRGTERVLRLLHHPDHRPWSIRAIAPLGRDGLRLHVDTLNFLEWQVFFYGDYEREVATVLRSHIRPGHNAIDVGANVGIHTLKMAKAVGSGRVIACEPSATLCARLQANLALNRFTNVSVHQVAAAAQAGTLNLYPVGWAAARSHMTFDASAAAVPGGPQRVRAVVLDDLVDAENPTGIDLIKIDTDGFEAPVLAGSRRLLTREHPALVFEYTADGWSQAGYTWSQVHEDLKAKGYSSFQQIMPEGLRSIPPVPPMFMNVVAT
jgi:FkbM family methyltransferase